MSNESREAKREKFAAEIGLTSNPFDYYFAVRRDPEWSTTFRNGSITYNERTVVVICPRKYYDENNCVYDGHVLGRYLQLPGFFEDMECQLSFEEELTAAQTYERLLQAGLVWSKKFTDFCNSLDSGYYYPEEK